MNNKKLKLVPKAHDSKSEHAKSVSEEPKTSNLPLALRKRLQRDLTIQAGLYKIYSENARFSELAFSFIEKSNLVADVERTYLNIGKLLLTYQSGCVVDISNIDNNSEHFVATAVPFIESLGIIERHMNGYKWITSTLVSSALRKAFTASETVKTEIINPVVDEEEHQEEQQSSMEAIELTEKERLMMRAKEINSSIDEGTVQAVKLAVKSSGFIGRAIGKIVGTTDEYNKAKQG